MVDKLGDWARTHTCGELRADDVGREVLLLGWVHKVRDLGHLVFVDLRDRHGLTQVVVEAEGLRDRAKHLRAEFVIGVRGRVRPRAAEAVNAKMPTGEIEVDARRAQAAERGRVPAVRHRRRGGGVRGTAAAVPLPRPAPPGAAGEPRPAPPGDDGGAEVLRQPGLLGNRDADARRSRRPKGARDYLVPSRVHPGEFYALPQSPQIFKQILMIAGIDRYFQIVKCFRDEDLRADRQPEFTQIDVEMSFATRELVFADDRAAHRRGVRRRSAARSAMPFPRMTYAEAMARYGSDKPDLRVGMAIADLSTRLRRLDASASSARRWPAAGSCAASSCPAARGVAQGARRAGRARPRRSAPAAWSGRAGAERPCRVRRSRRRARPRSRGARRRGRRRGRPPAHGLRAGGRHLEGARAAPAVGREEPRLAEGRRVRLHLGRRLPAARVGRGRAALGGHAPPLHVARRGGHGPAGGATRAACSRRPTTSCSTAARSAAAASASTTRRCSSGCSRCSASATRTRSCGSGSSSRRSNTARRRTAASRSASIASSRSWPASRRSAT